MFKSFNERGVYATRRQRVSIPRDLIIKRWKICKGVERLDRQDQRRYRYEETWAWDTPDITGLCQAFDLFEVAFVKLIMKWDGITETRRVRTAGKRMAENKRKKRQHAGTKRRAVKADRDD